MTLSEQQPTQGEVFKSSVGEFASAIEITRLLQYLSTCCKTKGAGDRIIDIAGFDAHKAIEKLGGSGQTVSPAAASGGIEQASVVMQRFSQRNRVKNSN